MSRRNKADNPHYSIATFTEDFTLPQDHDSRIDGVIVRLNEKGFGFIKSPGIPNDVFFHASALPADTQWESLRVNQAVTFQTSSTPKGLRAEYIELQ